MGDYSARHKYFLQILLREMMIEENKLKEIHKKVFIGNENHFNETIKLINHKINPLNLKLEKVICEFTGKCMYILYPTIKPKFSVINIITTLAEKEFISRVFQGIITSANGFISTSTAVNYANDLKNKGLKLVDAEKLMNDFIFKNLLMYTDNRQTNISFTPLAVRQMEYDFRDSFRDYITDCPLCMRIVFYGKTCDNCGIKIHFHCFHNFSSKNISMKCPDCHCVWI